MKLSEIKRVLAEEKIRLTKSLGQNFLHDANQLRRMMAAAQLTPGERVLEIGPGLGPLTEFLLGTAREVLAIEKDRRLVEFLRRRFDSATNLTLLHDDALEFLRRERRDWSQWKVVANLPYSVASPVLVELAEAERGPRRLVVTLQLEVAKRLAARAGAKDYGVLSLLVQLNYEPLGLFKIPAGCFFPEPGVDSACVVLERREAPLLTGELRSTFEKVVKRAFSQRRKMMLKVLKTDWPANRLEAAFARVMLAPQARAETASLNQFVGLTQCLAEMPKEEIFDVVNERDEVIGQKPRREVHRLGLLHRATHVLVFNARGQIFLQKRSQKKDRQPGLWDSSASGHVDAGEDYDACAVRELREEIGLEPKAPLQRLRKFPASADTGQEHVWVYRVPAEGPFRLDPEEIERGGWFAPAEVTRWIAERPQDFASAFLLIWKSLRQQGMPNE